MDRKVLLLYLREIRDLEFAMHKIVSMFNQEKKDYQNKKNSLDKLEYKQYSNWRKSEISLGLVITPVLFLGGMGLLAYYKFLALFGILAIIGAIVSGCYTYNLYVEDKEKKAAVENYNRQRQADYDGNRQKSKQLTVQWNKRYNFWSEEYDKVKTMLAECYSMNILPNQYRNLGSVYYIYEYMSSSQASLNDTLLHEHIESGIQRILTKLDTIIAQNEYTIFQNRIKEANDREMYSQTLQMLKTLESNSSMATEYARISAQYSKATSYFTLAQYLERNKK